MTNISISELKQNPSKAIARATDYPVAIENRNRVRAYLIGKELYDGLVAYLENRVDDIAVRSTDFKKGKTFESVAKKFGI